MIIGIDARSIGTKICGVSRYSLKLLQAMSKLKNNNHFIVYTHEIDEIQGLDERFEVRRTDCNRMNPIDDYKFFKIVKDDNLDVFHVFHSWLPLVLPSNTKRIVTLHDIFTVTDSKFFIKRKPFQFVFRMYFYILLKLSIMRSSKIITVSNYCKNEIDKYFSLDSDKVSVVYNASGIDMVVPNNNERNQNGYYFYLGNFRSYKNVETLIRGYSLYANSSDKPCKLILAGNDNNPVIFELIEKLGMSEMIDFCHKLSDEKIKELYTNAEAFIMPSNYEGFGIPILEAMELGVPTIISNAEALVEVSNGSSLIFDRKSPEDLSDKLFLFESNKDIRNKLIELGYKNIKRFTWEKSAELLLNIYDGYKFD